MERNKRIEKAINESGKKKIEIAKYIGVASSAITQWVKGETVNIKLENLYKLAEITGFNPEWIAIGTGNERPEASDIPSEDDYAVIEQFTAKCAAGKGYLNDHVEVKGGMAFKRSWLERMGLNPEHCSVLETSGQSMEPSINDGEIVLINHHDISLKDGKIYLLRRYDGEIIIKRLVKSMSGWLIRSDNADKMKYPDETISNSEIEQIEIIGRVVWHGGAL